MEGEQYSKNRIDWNKQFKTVTPFSKYLALALFVFLPFMGFWLGMQYEGVRVVKYNPVIVERVFEKEVIVESASTSTEEVRIVIFSGNVKNGGRKDCLYDGVCSTVVSEYEVIWSDINASSTIMGIKDFVRTGDRVEVYGRVIDDGVVTLYGNENYYLKKVSQKGNDTIRKERGNLLVVRNEGGLCVYGMCWNEVVVFTDGSWKYEDGEGDYNEGTIEKTQVSNLIKSVAETDFVKAKGYSFTDVCPTSYDGQKNVYTFYTELGVIKVDSCETDITKTSLFKDVETTILNGIYKEIVN